MTVMSLLAKAAIAKLAYTIVVDLLGGMPLSQVKDVAIHALLREPDVQIAVGMSVGQGVGSLFGDNIFGAVIGTTTGITLSLMLGVVGALSGLFMNHQGSAGAGSGGFARVAITHMTIGSPTQPTSIDVGVRVQSDTAEALFGGSHVPPRVAARNAAISFRRTGRLTPASPLSADQRSRRLPFTVLFIRFDGDAALLCSCRTLALLQCRRRLRVE